MGSVARRQLIGSIVVACSIAAAAALIAVRLVHVTPTDGLAHIFPIAQQPTFSTPVEQNAAA